MTALSEALPLALAASFSPPALLILILLLAAEHPRRLVFSYLAGAALFIGTLGVGGLFLLELTGATQQDGRTTSASLDLALGIALLALAVWAWRRRHRPPSDAGKEGALARISRRATTSMKWAFAAGLVVYLASPSYVAAIKAVADSGGSTGSQLLAVMICGIVVLLFIEIPALIMMIRPDGLKASLERFTGWLAGNSWLLVAALTGAIGSWLLATAIFDLA